MKIYFRSGVEKKKATRSKYNKMEPDWWKNVSSWQGRQMGVFKMYAPTGNDKGMLFWQELDKTHTNPEIIRKGEKSPLCGRIIGWHGLNVVNDNGAMRKELCEKLCSKLFLFTTDRILHLEGKQKQYYTFANARGWIPKIPTKEQTYT